MSQRLTNDQRRTAFLVTAMTVVAVVVAISALLSGPRRHGRSIRTSAHPSVPRIVGAATPVTTSTRKPAASPPPTPRSAGSGAPRQRLILAHAREFLSAYLFYEVKPLDARMRRALVQSTTVAFAVQLLRHTVDLPRGKRPAAGTVQDMELSESPDSSTTTVDATILHDGWVSGLTLDFQSAGGRWLVGGLS